MASSFLCVQHGFQSSTILQSDILWEGRKNRPLCSASHILLRTHAEVPCPGDHQACNSTCAPSPLTLGLGGGVRERGSRQSFYKVALSGPAWLRNCLFK